MILNRFDYAPAGDKSVGRAHGSVRGDTLRRRGWHSYRKAGIFEFRGIFHPLDDERDSSLVAPWIGVESMDRKIN